MYLKTVILLIKMYSEFLYANVAIFYMHHGVNNICLQHAWHKYLPERKGWVRMKSYDSDVVLVVC